MHETKFAQSILDTALNQLKKEKAKTVSRIYISLGELSGYSPEHLQFHFDEVAKGTSAGGALLVCETIPESAEINIDSVDIE